LEQYKALADVPPELEWLANITKERSTGKDKATGKGKATQRAKETGRGSLRPRFRRAVAEALMRKEPLFDPGGLVPEPMTTSATHPMRKLWRQAAEWFTRAVAPLRTSLKRRKGPDGLQI
jgi:hypothetical protein